MKRTVVLLSVFLFVGGCSFIQQRSSGFDLDSHIGKHFIDRYDLSNRLFELHSFIGIFFGFLIGGFSDTKRLTRNSEACAVHQGHDIPDQAHSSFSDQDGRRIVKL